MRQRVGRIELDVASGLLPLIAVRSDRHRMSHFSRGVEESGTKKYKKPN